jgi:hypothetical protein
MKKLLFFALAISIHFAANAADSFSTLEERMSGKEFKETGLVKLTEEELSALNDWIRRHSVATLENAAARPPTSTANAESSGDLRGFENQPKGDQGDDEIYATIDGTFDGWKGKGTQFKLTNGMIWQQVEADVFYVKPTENAEITIKKGMWNSWRLSMVGYSSDVRVKRVK